MLKTPSSSSSAKPGHVNLKMLAEYLQLSQTTVSLVLNNSPSAKSIPQETRQRVLDAAEKFNYRPNYFARSLRQSKSMSVGVLAPDLSEGYFTRVISGVTEELTLAKYFYFTACHDWRPELMEEYPRMLVERAVDGFLLLNTSVEIDSPVPVVTISAHGAQHESGSEAGPGITHIVLDHLRAAELALTHLHELGHRRIAFMRGPSAIPDSAYRWEGIQQAAQSLGLIIHQELVTSIDSIGSIGWASASGNHPMSPEIGYLPTKALLHTTRDFTAIFCFNDIAAIGAIRALKEAGLSVPDDVSIVGFDDIQSAAYSTPSLTTVQQPLKEMGKLGARILLERIANPEKTELAAEIVMQPALIVRESTGAANQHR
jgi:DNA-binding LacI/PurR family transcriptional regulator